jgi:hypothetical protein
MHSSQRAVSRMNKIRLLYIEANNKITELVDNYSASFLAKNKKMQPRISKEIKRKIQEKMKSMRESAVNGINSNFERCLDILNQSDLFLTSYPSTRRFSKSTVDRLEQSFKENQYPSDFEKSRLVKICNLTLKQINNWFTNKRNRNKMYSDCNKY